MVRSQYIWSFEYVIAIWLLLLSRHCRRTRGEHVRAQRHRPLVEGCCLRIRQHEQILVRIPEPEIFPVSQIFERMFLTLTGVKI
jgi:hypothetical protein